MGRFERGVAYYTRLWIPVGFPEDAVCCRYCPLMRAIDGGTRHMCMATGQIIYNIDRQPDDCPAEKEDENEHL